MEENQNNLKLQYEQGTIGRDVAVLRTLLNMTQQRFAEVILTSRVTINKIENAEDASQISEDMAFRLYYITQQVINNIHFPNYTREKARELQARVENELL